MLGGSSCPPHDILPVGIKEYKISNIGKCPAKRIGGIIQVDILVFIR